MENENKQRFIQFPETYDRRRLNKMYRAAGVPDRPTASRTCSVTISARWRISMARFRWRRHGS